MKARYFTILAAAALLASCAKDALNETPEVKVEKFRLTVGLPQEGKIVMGESVNNSRPLYWSDGDKIAVNGIESEALSGLEEHTTATEFTFGEALTTPYNVLYPSAISGPSNQIVLPAIQTYKSDGFADGMFPMAGYSADGSSITMSPLCAVVKIQVKRAATNPDEHNLASVTFKGRNGEQVSGAFGIDYENATLTPASDDIASQEVKVVKNIETSTATAAVYYIVVPAGTYSNGFEVKVKDQLGHYMKMSKTASWTAEAGKLYGMPEIEFTPTSTEMGIEISSAADLIKFAEDYNNKVFEVYGDEPVIATLTADIIFDTETSADFNATGGIGMKIGQYGGATEDYYFNGAVYGDNHAISGLLATVPVFAAIGESGAVSDLTIDENCSFTFTHPNTVELDAGALVGYNKGVVSNVTVDADVTIAAGEIAQVTALGGIAGRVTIGTIDNCTYTGNLSVPDGFEVDAKKTYVGGVVGSITNAAGLVKDSDFDGTIDFAGIVASTDKANPYLLLGGIVGSVNAGTVSNCFASDSKTKEITMDNSNSYTATIQNHSRKVYHLAQGGIAGYNAGSVSDCTNEASVKNFVLTTGTQGGTAADGNSRYYDYGGIVGLNAAGATVSNCVNNGLFESRSTPRIQKIGGVVGYNKGAVSDCSNTATGTIYLTTTNISPYSLRVGEVGGVIGNNEGTVSNIQNAGNISMDRTENAAGVELKFGGVIGLTTAAINGGAGKEITNSGNIATNYNGTTVTTAGIRYGGVVGSAQASVQNVINSGNVTYQTSSTNVVSKLYMGGVVGEFRSAANVVLSNCENEGEVFFNGSQNAAHTGNYVGGILGFTAESNVAISGCTNSGYIHGGNGSKQNGKTMFVGGIAAYLDGKSSVDNCENNGTLLNNQFNNTVTKVGSTFEGGIVGFALGTADDRISITNVTNDVNSGATITGGRRGYTGGAVGYGEYVDISNATNTNSYGGGSGYYLGGIAGWLVNGTISDSTYSGTSIETSQVQGAGGIVCTLDAGSTLDNCYSYLTTITHGGNACVDGSVAAKSVAGSTIKNCHYSDVYPICSDSNFTDGGGNVADL